MTNIRPRRFGASVPAIALIVVALFIIRTPRQLEFDSYTIFQGVQAIVRWLGTGAREPLGEVGPYPVFQYLTGLISEAAHAARIPLPMSWVWTTTSSVCFMALLWLTHRVVRRAISAPAAWVAVAIVLSGPLISYSTSTYNEVPAAFLAAALVAVTVGGGGPLICGLVFLVAALTKETAAPLLALTWLGAVVARRARLTPRGAAAHSIAIFVAFTLAVLCHAAFNLLRFGTIWNTHYLNPDLIIHDPSRRAAAVLTIWLAPNGGVWEFWPAMCAVLLVLMVVAAFRAGRREGPLAALVPALAIAAMLLILTAGLSAWHTPLGWWCWGPRLVLPWLVAAMLVMVCAYPTAFEALVRRILRRRFTFAITSLVLLAVTLPHALVLTDAGVLSWFFKDEVEVGVQQSRPNSELSQDTQHWLAWRKLPPVLLHPFLQFRDPLRCIPAAAYAMSTAAVLWQARRQSGGQVGNPAQVPRGSLADNPN